jgi:hypothetical protein
MRVIHECKTTQIEYPCFIDTKNLRKDKHDRGESNRIYDFAISRKAHVFTYLIERQ